MEKEIIKKINKIQNDCDNYEPNSDDEDYMTSEIEESEIEESEIDGEKSVKKNYKKKKVENKNFYEIFGSSETVNKEAFPDRSERKFYLYAERKNLENCLKTGNLENVLLWRVVKNQRIEKKQKFVGEKRNDQIIYKKQLTVSF